MPNYFESPATFGASRKRRPSALDAFPPLTPEDENSILSQLGGATTGGLALVGNILDTPGAFVRGILAGENPLPGIFDSTQRTSGRDLLETYGVLGPNTDGFDMGDVAGFGAEVLTDPLSVLLAGTRAVGAGGKAAAALGVLPKAVHNPATMVAKGRIGAALAKAMGKPTEALTRTLKTGPRVGRMTTKWDDVVSEFAKQNPHLSPAEINARVAEAAKGAGTTAQELKAANEPLGYLWGIGNPLSNAPAWGGITAEFPGALKAAELLDKAGDAVKYSLPIRVGSQFFDKDVNNTLSKSSQIAAREMAQKKLRAGEVAMGVPLAVNRILEPLGLDPETQARVYRKLAEGVQLDAADTVALGPREPAVRQAIELAVGKKNEAYEALQATGTNAPEFAGDITHYPRTLNDFNGGGSIDSSLFRVTVDSLKHRTEDIGNVPAHVLDALSLDPSFRVLAKDAPDMAATRVEAMMGVDPVQKAAWQSERDMLKSYIDDMKADPSGLSNGQTQLTARYIARNGPGGMSPEKLREWAEADILDLRNKIELPETIAKRFARMPVEAVGKTFFNDPLRDAAKYQRQMAEKTVAADGIMEFVTQHAGVGDGKRSVFDVLEATGFKAAVDPFTKRGSLTERAVELAVQKLGKRGILPTGGDLTEFLKSVKLPDEIADDAVRMMTGFHTPEALKPALKIVDTFNGIFKTGVTTPFPAFHFRNFVTGVWQNLVGGALDPRSYADARALIGGKDIKAGASLLDIPAIKNAGITNVDEAASVMRDMLYQYNVSGQSFLEELTGKYKPPSENFLGNIPGKPGGEMTFKGAVDKLRGDKTKQGFIGKVVAPIEAGKAMGNYVESLNRAAGFLTLLRQGMDPSVAAAKVRALHVDFAALSDAERAIMKRAIPFYSWSRGMLPEVLRELTTAPGGLTGQVAQLAGQIRGGPDAFLPEYLQGGLAAPVGKPDEAGKQSYLTNIDLPVESIFEPLHSGPGGMKAMGLDLLGLTTPLIKYPLEEFTGKQVFTGRDMRDLHSSFGLPPAVEQIVSNSPLARVKSTASQIGQMISGRKDPLMGAANLLTGFRFSDVDLPKQKSIQARELLQDQLRQVEGAGVFEKLYLPNESLANMTPDEIKALQLYRVLQNQATQKRKASQPKSSKSSFSFANTASTPNMLGD